MDPSEIPPDILDDPERALRVALARHQAGRLDEAERLYRALLERHPGHPAPLHLLGVLAYQRGDDDGALELLERARAAAPDDPELLSNLALVLRRLGREAEAERRLRRAAVLAPDQPAVHNNLGSLLLARGEVAPAADCFRRCLELDPVHPEALLNLANACLRAGRLEDGLDACRRCLERTPDRAEAWALQGGLEAAAGRHGAAHESFRRAWELEPGSAEHAYGAGLALESGRDWDGALPWYRRALGADPWHGPALSAALGLAKSLCLWDEARDLGTRFSAAVERGVEGLTPFILLAEPVAPALQRRCAGLWSAGRARAVAPLRERLAFDHPPVRRDRITVGYVSPDFRRHPTAYTKVGLLEHHDRGRFRVLAYCGGEDDGSDIRRRVERAVDGFVDTRGWPAERVARRIHEDGVDVLVDLKGHTLDAPTEVFALRPAPVQVSYMGYPGSTGSAFHDYAIVDDFVVPESAGAHYSERLARLPDTYWAEDSGRARPADPPSRESLGLPARGFVFCCFNNSFKISPYLFDIWCDILKETPGSVLWLQNSNPGSALASHLAGEVRRRGLDPARLVLAPRRPLEEYLAFYLLADLFLDTLPYNAHTTAADALWAGLPLLTCPGDTFASRVAGSLLRAVGLPELIVDSLEAYRANALELARDRPRLARLARRLRENRTRAPLFDTARFTRHMESALAAMHERRLAGLPPESFRVAPAE